MTWLDPGCSEPRAPVAACVLSVCCVSWCLVLICAAVCAGKLWRQVYTHCLYGPVSYYKRVCVCVRVCVTQKGTQGLFLHSMFCGLTRI